MQRVFYWVGLTVTQPFNTGIQRVARCLAKSLQDHGVEVIPVKWNAAADNIEAISADEAVHFAKWGGPSPTAASVPDNLRGEWLLVPELTVPVVPAGSNFAAFAHKRGMRAAAVFYDLIPYWQRSVYHHETYAAIEEYWRAFALCDLVLPISNTVKPDLDMWLAQQGLGRPLMSRPCLLSGELPNVPRQTRRKASPGAGPLKLLAVGTYEPRKNYPKVIEAVLLARKRTRKDIRLTIIGRRGDYPHLITACDKLADRAGKGVITLLDHVGDSEMRHIADEAHATIYGSPLEGFGLPVLESLWEGRPCICHNDSALAEIAPGGGTVMTNMLDAKAIAASIGAMATEAGLFDRLADEAVKRPLRQWRDYGSDVLKSVELAGHAKMMLDYEPLGA